MGTDYATLEDPLNPDGAIEFLMQNPWQAVIYESGAVYPPLGYGGYVKSTDGTKGIGGILSIVSVSDAMDTLIKALMQTVTPLNLTMPNGDTYSIFSDPAQQRKSSQQFSLMNTPWPINVWTFYYYEDVS
jgi:hypothetical protein